MRPPFRSADVEVGPPLPKLGMKAPPCVLTIAGSDSGGGAGIQADSRTIDALGGFPLTAITAITAQNTRGVTAWKPVLPELIAAQIDAVLSDFKVRAIKTGLLPGAAAVRAIAARLKKHRGIPLVIDPVLGSTSGTQFLNLTGQRALLRELVPQAILLTPNWDEAATLLGLRVQSFSDAENAAKALVAVGCRAVLVKGGHAPDAVCRDVLVMQDGRVRWFEGKRIQTRNTHGTGCVLASAIATELAKGVSVEKAVGNAREFLRGALSHGRKTKLGHGRGPAFMG